MWYHNSFSDDHEVIECLESGEKIERKEKKIVRQVSETDHVILSGDEGKFRFQKILSEIYTRGELAGSDSMTVYEILALGNHWTSNWEELKFECEDDGDDDLAGVAAINSEGHHFVVWEAPAGSQSWDAFFQAYTWTEHLEELKRIAEDDFMKKFEEKGVCVCVDCATFVEAVELVEFLYNTIKHKDGQEITVKSVEKRARGLGFDDGCERVINIVHNQPEQGGEVGSEP